MNLSKSIVSDMEGLLEYAIWASKELTINAEEERKLPKNFGKKKSGKEGCFIVADLFPKTYWNIISLRDKVKLGQAYFCETLDRGSLKNIIVPKQDSNGNLLKTPQNQQIYEKI